MMHSRGSITNQPNNFVIIVKLCTLGRGIPPTEPRFWNALSSAIVIEQSQVKREVVDSIPTQSVTFVIIGI